MPARLVHVASNQDRKHQHLSTDMLACIEFSLDGMLLATAGCAKQVWEMVRIEGLIVPYPQGWLPVPCNKSISFESVVSCQWDLNQAAATLQSHRFAVSQREAL